MRATDEAGPSKLAKRPPATLFAPNIIEAIARCILCPYTLLVYLRAQPARALSPALCSLLALAATTPSIHLWPRLVIASTNEVDTDHYVALLRFVPSVALLERIAPSSVLGRAIVAQSPKLHVANLATLDHVANAVDAYAAQIIGVELKSIRALPRTTTRSDLGACLATCSHLQTLTLRVPLESLSLVASALASKHATLRALHLTLFEPRAKRIPLVEASDEASVVTALHQIPSVHVGLDGLATLPALLYAALRDVASIDSVYLGRAIEPTTTILDGTPLSVHWRSLWLDDMKLNAAQASNVTSTLEDATLSRLVLNGFAPLPILLPTFPTLLQLRALRIQAVAIPDATARDVASAIGHLSLLVELAVRQAELSDAALSTLTGAFRRDEGCGRYLAHLDLSSNAITSLAAVVSALPKLPALRSLDVHDNQIGAVHIPSFQTALCAHPALHVLDVSRNGLGTDGVVTLLRGAVAKTRLHVNASENGLDVDACYKAHPELKTHRDRLMLEEMALWNVPIQFEYSLTP